MGRQPAGIYHIDGEEMLAEPIMMNSGECTNCILPSAIFKEAIEKESSSGFEYVEYNSQSYLFTYSKVGRLRSYCSLVPKSIIIGQF